MAKCSYGLTTSCLTINIVFYKNDPSPVRIGLYVAKQNSCSLKGRAKLRYICALLEADIVRHLNHRLAMKVS
ncbi:hypothetical protein [Photorhabdus cinerea]|uniref:hypothetical protein n=1 Tax=Photorhabdus cinerea TaxID=471575 RepID=UPI0014083BDD|nr:hypothetical protein [Photorhabdus cinerea]